MKRIAPVIIAFALLLPASAALADSCPYGSLCAVTKNTAPTGNQATTASTTKSTAQSTLPFTGLDVVLLAAGGGTLLGTGLVVRRLSRGVS